MGKEKITVTLDETLVRHLDTMAATLHESRSSLVETAIRFWKSARIRQDLIEGYRAMAGEDLKVAEDNLPAGYEALK